MSRKAQNSPNGNSNQMGLQAVSHADSGTPVVPSTDEEWLDWVGSTSTRNYLLDDTLVDWLDKYGKENGFQPDLDLPGYDPRTDFTEFIFRRAHDFETTVLAHLKTLTTVVTVASSRGDSRSLAKAEETFRAMEEGTPVIYRGVLRDAENRTYGVPDLLVRSDELARLFPGTLTGEVVAQPARAIRGAHWHYRVVDIKFATIDLLAGGDVANSGSKPAYKGQLYIYNRALGRIQGYLAPVSYLLGRSWMQTVKNVTSRGESCLERLGPVGQDSTLSKGKPLGTAVEEAVAWVRRLRREGMKWSVLPEPTVPELRPNMGSDHSGPWTAAKRRIGRELQELTSLWYVGVDKRRDANNLGIYKWTDAHCSAAALGVSGPKTQPVLQAVLDINRSDGLLVAPPHVTSAESDWRAEPTLEFYVDFETVSDLDDDFSKIPKRGGQPIIFMIGCGHVEDGGWQFRCFTVETLTETSEATIIDAWLAHMREVRGRLSPSGGEPLVIHWSQAETSNIRDAYNAAIRRHPERAKDWSTPIWFDFLKQVIRAEPVVVRGAWGFGLKKIAQAMYTHRLIETYWDDGPTDGLGAMIGAWSCGEEAKGKDVPLVEIDLMQSIQRYNEVDCKVMMEIVRYLRANH
jgi:hypothetical protein